MTTTSTLAPAALGGGESAISIMGRRFGRQVYALVYKKARKEKEMKPTPSTTWTPSRLSSGSKDYS